MFICVNDGLLGLRFAYLEVKFRYLELLDTLKSEHLQGKVEVQ